MKKILFILFAGLLFACDKEELNLARPSDVSNMSVEPRVGGVLAKWSLPVDSNFLFLELRYTKKDAVVTTKVSRHTDSVFIPGLLNKLEYSFELQPFNANRDGSIGGSTLTAGPVRPIRRPVETTYYPNELTKLTVTNEMIQTYTQEVSEGPKSNLVDGDRTTYWHSAWSSGVAPLPHWVKIQFAEPQSMGAIKYFFRNNNTQSGRPTQIALDTSEDGISWTQVWISAPGLVISSPSTEEKTLAFDKNYQSKFFRVKIMATQGNTTWVALGDMSFFSMKEQLTDLEELAEKNY